MIGPDYLQDAGSWLEAVERVAARRNDGHWTLFRFTTGYKAFLDTVNPDLDASYGHIWSVRTALQR